MNVLIVGGGKVGGYLAGLLRAAGHRITVIEEDDTAVHKLQRDLPAEILRTGNGTDPAVLESAGIRAAQVVAAVTGADETNLVITSLARFEFGVNRVIARVNNPRNAWLFTTDMGVDAAVNQADLIAHLIAEQVG